MNLATNYLQINKAVTAVHPSEFPAKGVATLRQCTIDCRSNYLRVMKVLSGGAKWRDMKISPGFDQMEGRRAMSLANFEIACRESFSMRVKSDLSLRYCLAED